MRSPTSIIFQFEIHPKNMGSNGKRRKKVILLTTHTISCKFTVVLVPIPELRYWYGGPGTNTRAEILALWGLLWFPKKKLLDCMQIYGDSKSLIEGILGHTNFPPPNLCCWLDRIKTLKLSFQVITFQHIFRESIYYGGGYSFKRGP